MLGHNPYGPFQALRKEWEQPVEDVGTADAYHQEFQSHLQVAQYPACENVEAQQHQKERYDTWTKLQKFREGQKVLVLLLTSTSKLLTKWQGPFEIIRWVKPMD